MVKTGATSGMPSITPSQLSLAVGGFTVVSEQSSPFTGGRVAISGTGGVLSVTSKFTEHVDELPVASVAVQIRVWLPGLNGPFLSGVIVILPVQLSVADGAGKSARVTKQSAGPVLNGDEMAGQIISGG